MRRIGTFVFVVLFAFASASPAGAQSIRDVSRTIGWQGGFEGRAGANSGAPRRAQAKGETR